MANQTSIRTKVLISTGILYFLILIALVSAFYIKTDRTIKSFEIENTGINIQRLAHEVNNIRTTLSAQCNDWAAWDDTYRFISDNNREYADANLNQDTLANLKVNTVIYINKNTEIVRTVYFNPFSEKIDDFPEKLLSSIMDEKKILSHNDLEGHAECFIMFSDMPVLLVSRPVKRSDHTGPINGTLIFGKIFTDSIIRETGKNININVSVVRSGQSAESVQSVSDSVYDPEKTTIEYQKPDESGKGTAYISIKKSDAVNAWIPEKNSSGRHIFDFTLSIPRNLSKKIVSDTVVYFLIVLVAASISILIILLFLDRAVLSPLYRISGHALQIASKADFSLRVKMEKGKEFGMLSQSINDMISSLEQYHLIHMKDMEALLESEAYLASLLDSIDCGIITADASDMLIININRTGSAMTGYSRDEITGMRYDQVIKNLDENCCTDAFDCTGLMTCEGTVLKKDGGFIPVIKSSIVLDTKKRRKLVITFVNISILKEAEAALRANEAKYREFFEQDLTGDFISDLDGHILDCNQAFAEIFGFESITDVMSKNAVDFYFNEETRKQLVDALRRDRYLEEIRWVMKKNDGSQINIVGNVLGIFDEKGELTGIRGYLYDETERMVLERALRQVYKMEAIGTLAGGIAHDFNNILSAILGQAELAMIMAGPNSSITERLEQITSSTRRAKNLIKKLLAFSSKNSESGNIIRMSSVLNESLSMIRSSIPSRIKIVTRIESDSAINADPNQIHQIVMNICINALEAIPKDTTGRLEIALEDVVLEKDNDVMLGYGEYICLSISDTGHGMSADTVERIFDPFFTTKQKSGNTGMGLSVIHGIVRTLNAGISVKSEPGHGTVFKIYLPKQDESLIQNDSPDFIQASCDKSETERLLSRFMEREADLKSHEPELPDRKESIQDYRSCSDHDQDKETDNREINVLIVEDEAIILEMLSEMVRHMGFRSVAIQNPVKALVYFRSDHKEVDVVMTDLSMPEMSGDRLAEEIFSISPDTPVIICSGYSVKKYAEESNLRGPRIFLKKPIVSGVLFRTLSELKCELEKTQKTG